MQLVRPTIDHLPGYKLALEKDWSPDNVRGLAATKESLDKIAVDPHAYIASLDDTEAKGSSITFPDGSVRPRLPGFRRWMWDGEFCGSIGFRWQKGTSELPAYIAGHIGYAVVPWKRQRGYATKALALLLAEIEVIGLDYVKVTADPDNIASQKVILSNGGVFKGTHKEHEALGGDDVFLYHINLKLKAG